MARPGLTTHRKFRRLARLLGSQLIARGALELIWESCYESGDDYLGTARDLETLVGWMGDCGSLATALVDCGAPEGVGFIEPVSGDGDGLTYRVHDLWHHAPDYVTKRRRRELERREKKAPTAERRETAPNGGQWQPSPDRQTEVDRTPAHAHAPALAPAPAPAPARRDEEPRATLVLAPRGGGLTGKHHLHDPATWAACEAGVCVPPFVIEEWRTQIGRAGGDADAEIRELVVSALARAPARFGEPAKFWRGVWHARHGQAVEAPTTTKTGRSIAAAQRVIAKFEGQA